MAYHHLKDPAAIALSGLAGAGVGFTYRGLLVGASPLPEAITLCAVVIFPILGGWLSTRAGNVWFFPIGIFIGISVASPPGIDPFWIVSVLASSLFQGTLAAVAFFAGYGAHRLFGSARAKSLEA